MVISLRGARAPVWSQSCAAGHRAQATRGDGAVVTMVCCVANRGYVIVAWIWSILFYLGLDPIKWAMAYAMNEDGFRTRTLQRRRAQPPPEVRPAWGILQGSKV